MNIRSRIDDLVNKTIKKYLIFFIIGFNIAIFAVFFYLFLLPQYESKKNLANEYVKIRDEYTSLVSIKNRMEQFRKEFNEKRSELQQLITQLPEKKDIPNLLRSISNIGGGTRVKVRYFEPKPVINKEFYAEMPFELRYSGSYHNIGYFFDEVRKMQRLVHIPVFFLESKGTSSAFTIEGVCTAKTFLYLKERPKEVKPKKEEKKESGDIDVPTK